EAGFAGLPDHGTDVDPAQLRSVLAAVAERLHDNYPYFHPLYAGQMLKPPHPVARLAYALALWINPNNHALDGGRASSAMEKEAVAEIAAMLGWPQHLGHLTGGGTMANLEALWIAGQLRPGLGVVASSQAHYTHSRITGVLGIPFQSAAVDGRGRMDLTALSRQLDTGAVGTVVVTLGTTAIGAVDPLPALLRLRERHGFRIHADTAYGGYFRLAGNLEPEVAAAYEALHEVDSLVIDPHKHGLQPYGCGCVLFRDPSVGRLYKHDSPYTYFSSAELHLGEISLECSRPGAAAVALWATQRLFPLVRGGQFAAMLEAGREAALDLHRRLGRDPRFIAGLVPDLDIVVWAVQAKGAIAASAAARRLFAEAGKAGLHLALAELPIDLVDPELRLVRDQDTVTCLRSVLMKPEHREWMPRIWELLSSAAG
ncbi:MAG TPA: aminotransferase class I/II-fold pyridoxal phosphate-dependent enzyme, partial [Gemmatimonadales bacterium]|nr:aminotransferase class I/II-fold pyridoxal phosphate-dependent enzyme [Gemmatimonadales bacterium]